MHVATRHVRRLCTRAMGLAPSDAALQLAQLPEFAEARSLVARGAHADAAPLIARALDICTHMPMPSMRFLALEARASVEAAMGQLDAELDTRTRLVADTPGCSPAEAALARHGLVLCRLRRGEARDAEAEASAALEACTDLPWEASAMFKLHLLAAAYGDGPVDGDSMRERARALTAALPDDSPQAQRFEWEAKLLLGEYLTASDADDASAQALDALAGMLPGGTGCVGRLGCGWELATEAALVAADAHAQAAELEKAENVLACGLRLAQSHAAEASVLVPRCVHALALVFDEKRDALTAEGLHRSAVDQLASSPRVGTLAGARALHAALLAYARLLDGLETNGRPRRTEAEQHRTRADELAAHFDGQLSSRFGHACFIDAYDARHTWAWWQASSS